MFEKIKAFIKGIYSVIPFKKYFFDLLKRIWIPPKSIYRFLVHQSVFTLHVDNRPLKIKHHGFHFYIENEFYWKGFENSSFEKVSRRLWMALARQSQVIFDIGANTGLYTLLSQHVQPDALVYAFEPIERNMEKMRFNCRINGMDKVQFVHAAASNKAGRHTIFVPRTEVSTTSTLERDVAGNLNMEHPVEIETITLDSFVEQNNISNVDLVKIDVEGHEVAVLEGFARCIRQYKPTILAEIRIEEHGQKISEILEGNGYLYYDIDEVNAPARVSTLEKSTYNNFLICMPEIARQLHLSV
jgi:FkbM family methyltransferase